ncbi:MAG: response regulator transcription factor [Nitrospirae bacterium]|nr:response regulator transcription factor [Nitrospirota bacterium]
MNKINNQIKAKIKTFLTQLSESIESEPMIFIDAKGKHWFNANADEFIVEKDLLKDDFVQWIKIGANHLHNFRYGEIDISMMKLPEEGAIAFLRHSQSSSDREQSTLTNKETEVLRYLSKGFSNKKIAEILNISPGTVNSHLDRIYQKLGCSNRSVACIMALQNGMLLPKSKIPPKKLK